jgi:ASC-1-like (ASCH) protein
MEFDFEMHLNESPYRQIKGGRKRFEARLFDEKRQELRVGGVGKIYLRPEDKEFYFVRIVDLKDYMSFEKMFLDLGVFDFGWEKGVGARQAAEDMRKYYSFEDEEKFGVLGIELEVLG